MVRAIAFAPPLALGNPSVNAQRLLECLDRARAVGASLCLFPELALTGFSCEDLHLNSGMLAEARSGIARVAAASDGIVAVVGAPYVTPDGRLFNTAFVVGDGQLLGAVPKRILPNYAEFYDLRWFASGRDVNLSIQDPELGPFTLSDRLLFDTGQVRFAVEICEDLWAPDPIGNSHALAGAEIILNPSASNELVAKADYRRDLVRMASATRICGYLYASAGPLESTKDVVFSGHLLAAENGVTLGESERFCFQGSELVAEFDVDLLRHDRRWNKSFADSRRPTDYVCRDAPRAGALEDLERRWTRHPFVPGDVHEFEARAREILAIQSAGLVRRVRAAATERLIIGISGGLDSTWAYLVCLEALAQAELPNERLLAVTMPGPGTGSKTRELAGRLTEAARLEICEIDIAPAVKQHLEDLEHTAEDDVVFENAQARERTQLLFNLANKHGGIVVGTGDLSELALGWCTFNGDHMASYNVNASVPKTLIRYLVSWYATHRASPELAETLREVLEIPVSPELLKSAGDGFDQRTEDIIGPYELHDFFLYHYVRHGFAPRKIFELACRSFAGDYERSEICQWLAVFFRRFHQHQFKRTTLPPGPKVGTVSLSPRGDWRMPDEVDIGTLVEEIEGYS